MLKLTIETQQIKMKILTVLYAVSTSMSIIALPLSISCCYSLNKYWNEEFVRIRGRRERLTITILTSFVSLIYAPFVFNYEYFVLSNTNNNNNNTNFTGNSTNDNEHEYLYLGILILILLFGTSISFQRCHTFGKIKISDDLQDWKLHLNPNYTTWIIKHWNIIGNNRVLLVCAIIIWIIFSLPCIMIISLNSGNITFYTIITVGAICQSSFLLLFGSYSAFILRYIKLDNDIWYVNRELKLIKKCVTVFFLSSLLCSIGYILKFNLFFENNFYYIGIDIIIMQYGNIIYFTVSVIIPIYQNVNSPFYLRYENFQNKNKNENKNKKQKEQKIKPTIIDIFNDSVSFDLFMAYLSTEFTVENGLFIVYMLQFQSFINSYQILKSQLNNVNINNNSNNKGLIYKGKLILPENVPLSPIFDKKNIDCIDSTKAEFELSIKLAALNGFIIIYEKFIIRDFAPFEINISSQTRDIISIWYVKLKELKRLCALEDIHSQQQLNKNNNKNKNLNSNIANVFSRAQNSIGLAKNDLILTINDLKHATNSNLNSQRIFSFEAFDFGRLWMDLISATNEIISLTNQSVLRYYSTSLNYRVPSASH